MKKGKAKIHADVRPESQVSEALSQILRTAFREMTQWEDKARSWEDIEGVHQMRVNSRRMRAALSAFRAAVPKQVSQPWNEELGWIAGTLGPARDIDVFITEGLASVQGQLPLAGAEKLQALAEQHRTKAYEAVRAMLAGDRYASFKEGFRNWLETRAWEQADLAKKPRKTLDIRISKFARGRLDRLERRVLQAGAELNKHDARQLHQLRIECKKLRYGCEFFSPVIPGLDTFINQLKGLQDLLGVMNDVSVMSGLLEDLLRGTSDPDVISYAGGLVGWRSHQSSQLLDSFEDRWQAFTHAKHPW